MMLSWRDGGTAFVGTTALYKLLVIAEKVRILRPCEDSLE